MANFRQFVTCHCHPASLDSASTPAQFIKREVELGTGYCTVTDHGTLAACKEVFDLAVGKNEYEPKKKAAMIPIMGLEAYLRDDNCPILLGNGIPRTVEVECEKCGENWKDECTARCSCGPGYGKKRETFKTSWNKYMHVTMHFRSYAGYQSAVKLLTKADLHAERHGSERKPIFSWSDLEEIGSHDVTMTSSCLIGVVQRHLVGHDDMNVAIQHYERMRSICKPGNWYVEVFPHRTDKNWTKAVVIKLEGDVTRKYYFGKKLRTNEGELEAASLAADWAKKDHAGHRTLLAVKNFRVWDTEPVALAIESVQAFEGFVPNECRPWTIDGDLQKSCNEFVLALAEKYGDPILIGDDSHFAHPKDKIVQDIRLAQSGGSWRFAESYHRQSSEEAFNHFHETLGTTEKQFEGWVNQSLEWADGFKNFKFPSTPHLPNTFYPKDTLNHALHLIEKHGRMRWDDPVYVERLQYELALYHDNGKMDLLPYFFPLEEICEWYSKAGKLTGPGRGSAAGTLFAYLLEITHANPIQYKLSIDRFLTQVRIDSGAIPDIDQDLPDRDSLIGPDGYLKARFGDCFVQVSTDTKLKLRSSVKDVHRALYRELQAEIEALTKRFGQVPQGVEDHAHVFGYEANGGWVPGAIEHDPALIEYASRYPKEWEIVQACLGITRQKGRHASAFLLSDVPVQEFIPLTEVGGVRVTSYTAKSVESVGGIKYDLLGLTSLEVISNALALINRDRKPPQTVILEGIRVPGHRLLPFGDGWTDIWNLPEDPRVFADIAEGRSETVFQFNTSGARQWMKYFNHPARDGKPIVRSMEDLAAFTALDRPGPLDVFVQNPEDGSKHNALVEYARRARGLMPSPDVPEAMASLLPETHGLLVYQEQLQSTYQSLTGCSGAEAEEFRRAVAKKDMAKVQKKYDFFIEKASAGLGEENAQEIWKFYSSWAQYGFNRSIAGNTILPTWKSNPKQLIDFVPGDIVPGVDDQGQVVPMEVVALHDHGYLPALEVTFSDGFSFVVSPNHKFLTDQGQVPILQIIEGDLEVIADGSRSSTWADHENVVRGRRRAKRGVRTPSSVRSVSKEDERTPQSWSVAAMRNTVAQKSTVSAQEDLREVSGSETEKYSFSDGPSERRELVTGTQENFLRYSQENFGPSGDPAPESGTTQSMAREGTEKISRDCGQTCSFSEKLQCRSVDALVSWLGVRTSELCDYPEASGFHFPGRHGLAGGGRLLALLRCDSHSSQMAKQESTSFSNGTGERCDAQCGSSQTRSDADPFIERIPQSYRRIEGRVEGLAYSDAPLSSTGSLVRRKVVRWRPVGFRRMYDLEVAHPKHNFLLGNGVVTSNSHSVCYSIIGYACAYLKHHFPLEWWCAVFRSATKEEIADTFWAHAGHLVDLPNINRSSDEFTIVGDRIQAPFSLLDGIGPVAHTQIMAGRPYQDILDFARKARGGRGVNRGVVHKLILTGVLDDLFPAKTTVFKMLSLYEEALALIATEEAGPTPSGRPRKPKTPEPVDTKYATLSPLERYLIRKEILPVYSEKIAPLILSPMVQKSRSGRWYLVDEDGDHPTIASTAAELEELEARSTDGKYIRAAVIGYVQAIRDFSYGAGKRAREVVLDFDGGRRSFVYWLRANGRDPSELLVGSIVGAWLSRRHDGRPFSLDDWTQLAAPLSQVEEQRSAEPKVYSSKDGAPADAVEIGRPSPLGNPFSHLKESTAQFKTDTVEQAVRAYEEWLPKQPALLELIRKEILGKNVKCPCAPKKGLGKTERGGYRCHGQVVLRMAAKLNERPGAKSTS